VEKYLFLLKLFLGAPISPLKMEFKSIFAQFTILMIGASLALPEARQLHCGSFGKDVCGHE
jgi:hypothetical protein